jgi:hypothetical protein
LSRASTGVAVGLLSTKDEPDAATAERRRDVSKHLRQKLILVRVQGEAHDAEDANDHRERNPEPELRGAGCFELSNVPVAETT